MRVITFRIQHHLTQAQLAERLGMKQPHVARLEAGGHEPSLPTLRRLARVMEASFHIDITPDYCRLSG
ncbi:MAG TPA: helix-turn-helix transcriptional regulator [Candidatus Dormibacteraeota bacterium]|nr:helix-turn-helix transcriptional regulator [Candidatus Dormibacteraeota bacterium]